LRDLLQESPALRIWSAGCSRGQEPYTIAMLLEEISGPNHRHQILATDLDRSVLGQAKAGGPYTADDVANVPATLLRKHFDKSGTNYIVKPALRRRVQFRQHNLLSEPFRRNLDLIICRNVVIYFQKEIKEKLYRGFYDSLRPGGTLFVGGTEIIPRTAADGFTVKKVSFYQKTG
jgi:chemotaxis protein methyltransferase CheR